MSENLEPRVTDEDRNRKFKTMLRAFESIIHDKPAPETVKQDLLDLSETCRETGILNARQVDAIHCRCMNYIDGSYGKNSIKSEYMKTAV